MKFVTLFFYYVLLIPISKLPTWVHYRLSDFLFYIVYYVVPYRYGVVLKNLKRAFPEKDDVEIEMIAKSFYRHFCDITVEGIRGFGISLAEVQERYHYLNPEVAQKYYDQGRRLIYVTGHYGNWEWSALTLPGQQKYETHGVFQSLKNKFLNRKVKESRERFGSFLLNIDDVSGFRAKVENEPLRLTAIGFFMDQSPARTGRKYWLKFFGQWTPTQFKAESLAARYNDPVVFVEICRVKRGRYELKFIPLEENPKETRKGEITEKFMALLEARIRKDPSQWLWTHNRWKIKFSKQELDKHPDLCSQEARMTANLLTHKIP
jgi:KDO2-lipid IV(A) lauroyltransferase